MNLLETVNKNFGYKSLDLLATQVVEGFVAGLHKSPFHGFSAEFAEHKIYNSGESTKHIDWKLYARTDRLYTKRYDDETNLRCHIIIDNSSSMHYPKIETSIKDGLNKVSFSILAAAFLIKMLKKQQDAIGMSIYSDQYEFYAPEKGSDRHQALLIDVLEKTLSAKPKGKSTDTHAFLHQIAEKIHRRSLILLFTDMFQPNINSHKLLEALRHLKFNKHEVVFFHVYDKEKELGFGFENSPRQFMDVETGRSVKLYPEQVKKSYQKMARNYFKKIKLLCLKYDISYVEADIQRGFNPILTSFLVERKRFS